LLAGSIAALALPRVAMAAPPSSVAPPSVASKSRGELELGLGVLLTGTAAGLIAFGSVQLVRARAHVEFCNAEPIYIDERNESSGIDPCVFDPPSLGFASAGLSWGFSTALLVGAGLLLARGGRLQTSARRATHLSGLGLSFSPWGGGATLGVRF
jgi:hypothetical protein